MTFDNILATIFEGLQEGMVIQDSKGMSVKYNQAALDILGLTEDEILQKKEKDPRWALIKSDGSPFPPEEYPASITLREARAVSDVMMGIVDPKRGLRWMLVNSTPLEINGEIHSIGTFRDLTDETHLNAEVKAYKDGINTTPIMARTNLAGEILYVNDMFCKISGYTREELIGKNHRIVNSGYHDKKFFEEMWKTIKSGNVWRGEIKNKTKSGEPYWVDTIISPIKDYTGKITEFFAFRYDITKQKAHEEELQRALSELQDLYDNTAHAIIQTDKNGTIIRFNKRAETMLGYEASELIGKENPGIFHDLDETIQRSIEFGHKFDVEIKPGFETFVCHTDRGLTNSFEWIYIHKSGKRLNVLLSITSIKDKEGSVISYLGMAQDITEQKEQERSLSLTLKANNVGTWKYNPVDQSLVWDKSMYDLYDMKEEDFSDHYAAWESSLHPDYKEKSLEALEDALLGRKQFDTTFAIITPQKKVKYIKSTAVVDRNKDGEPLMMTGVNSDITNEHEALQEARRQAKLAMKAERAKSAFLANMSHEMRTPLNGIVGMLQILRDTDLNDNQVEMLKTLQFSSDNLVRLINDILDLSKIEAEKIELESVSFNLANQLQKCVEVFKQQALEKGIELNFKPANRKLQNVYGDVIRIQQIAMNLISNAVKFTSTGEVSVELSIEEETNHQYSLAISFVDTGIGINEDALANLFEDFQQADNTISRSYGGTGLGLAISSKLASLMDGSIEVTSELDEGSTFIFKVPLKKSNEAESFEIADTNCFENLSQKYPHRILIVEDNSMNQLIIKTILTKLGYECEIAQHGEEALQIMNNKPNHFSIIFMDIHMPVMDGITATKELSNRYQTSLAPIVAMTANVMSKDKEECFNAGMSDFITKPISTEQVKRVLRKFAS